MSTTIGWNESTLTWSQYHQASGLLCSLLWPDIKDLSLIAKSHFFSLRPSAALPSQSDLFSIDPPLRTDFSQQNVVPTIKQVCEGPCPVQFHHLILESFSSSQQQCRKRAVSSEYRCWSQSQGSNRKYRSLLDKSLLTRNDSIFRHQRLLLHAQPPPSSTKSLPPQEVEGLMLASIQIACAI